MRPVSSGLNGTFCSGKTAAGVLLFFACATLPMAATAQDLSATQFTAHVLPKHKTYYNPLRHGSEQKVTLSYSTQMDNATLLRTAEQLRSDSMSQEQRALNHQWLAQGYHEYDNTLVGSSVFSALMKMGFKTYWEGNRITSDDTSGMAPNTQGDGKFTEDVDYKIRISGNKIKLSLEYEF